MVRFDKDVVTVIVRLLELPDVAHAASVSFVWCEAVREAWRSIAADRFGAEPSHAPAYGGRWDVLCKGKNLRNVWCVRGMHPSAAAGGGFPVSCEWESNGRQHYECRVVWIATTETRRGLAMRLCYDARGEVDLRDAQTSTIGVDGPGLSKVASSFCCIHVLNGASRKAGYLDYLISDLASCWQPVSRLYFHYNGRFDDYPERTLPAASPARSLLGALCSGGSYVRDADLHTDHSWVVGAEHWKGLRRPAGPGCWGFSAVWGGLGEAGPDVESIRARLRKAGGPRGGAQHRGAHSHEDLQKNDTHAVAIASF